MSKTLKKSPLIRITANVSSVTAARLTRMANRNFRKPGTEAKVAIENHVQNGGRK